MGSLLEGKGGTPSGVRHLGSRLQGIFRVDENFFAFDYLRPAFC